jgi:ABC-type hemin transport system substrate-binding protein
MDMIIDEAIRIVTLACGESPNSEVRTALEQLSIAATTARAPDRVIAWHRTYRAALSGLLSNPAQMDINATANAVLVAAAGLASMSHGPAPADYKGPRSKYCGGDHG